MRDLHRELLLALDRARPGDLVDELRATLERHVGVHGVRLLLADYQLTVLLQVRSDVQVSIDHGRAGESFVTQIPLTHAADDQTDVYLPVTVHGDRIGVLHLTLAAPVGDEELLHLQDVATLVGYVLRATIGQTDLLQRSTRARRLSLPAELQWQLLGSRSCHAPDYLVAGHLEPAYAVYADNYDWSQDGQVLCLSVTDASHMKRGVPLLSTLAVTALRNGRRAGLGIEEQAFLAGEAVVAHHGGKRVVGAVLMDIDLSTGHARVIKAGSPEIVLIRSGNIHPLGLTDQLPLGLFEGTEYIEESVALVAGDRLVLMTDGVLEAISPQGERYVDRRLFNILTATILWPPGRVVRAIVNDLIEHCKQDELDDDAVVVCLDWKGLGSREPLALPEADLAVRDGHRRLRAVPSDARHHPPAGSSSA